MISYRQNAAVAAVEPPPAPVPVPACERCGGSGMILWDGKYRQHTHTANVTGPCIRCRPADFCEQIGLKREAVAIRARKARAIR